MTATRLACVGPLSRSCWRRTRTISSGLRAAAQALDPAQAAQLLHIVRVRGSMGLRMALNLLFSRCPARCQASASAAPTTQARLAGTPSTRQHMRTGGPPGRALQRAVRRHARVRGAAPACSAARRVVLLQQLALHALRQLRPHARVDLRQRRQRAPRGRGRGRRVGAGARVQGGALTGRRGMRLARPRRLRNCARGGPRQRLRARAARERRRALAGAGRRVQGGVRGSGRRRQPLHGLSAVTAEPC